MRTKAPACAMAIPVFAMNCYAQPFRIHVLPPASEQSESFVRRPQLLT